MALKHVNALIVGAGAGGGVVAKELAAAGLGVVLLERGNWYSAADCRKDDLRNQRTTVLGNAFGPDDDRNPRVLVDDRGARCRRECRVGGRRTRILCRPPTSGPLPSWVPCRKCPCSTPACRWIRK